MIKIYTVAEAKDGILRRGQVLEPDVPEGLQVGIRRLFGEDLGPEAVVRRLLTAVRAGGDAALREWTERIDGVLLDGFLVSGAEMATAVARTSPQLYQALQLAADRIRAFHQCQPLPHWTTDKLGGRLGQRVTPIQRVGVYVPGGTAPLPSSLLMSVIPAQVAGVPEIVVATPPGRDGAIHDAILAAAHIAGVPTIYKMGGAQAIGALAFGTESVPPVDKIVGAGNIFVTLAKRQVYGLVGIDGLYGPTETVVVADETADPAWVAADLLAQAEHDLLATAVLLTPSRSLAEAVQYEVARQMETLARAEILAVALANRGGIVLTADMDEACQLASDFAAEHICIATQNPAAYTDKIANAGGLFVGERSFEVLGDYVAGPSHVMPTGGTARFASPLNVLDFVKISSIIELDEATSAQISPAAATIAAAEGLTAHQRAAEARVAEVSALPDLAAPLRHFVRPEIVAMEPYVPIVPFEVLSARLGRQPEEIVKLDANENPYGPSPQTLAALANGRYYHIYPDPEANELRQALSAYTAVPKERLLVGAGADELIDLLLRVLLSPGDGVIDCPPSFGMYPFSTAVNAGRYVAVPRREDFGLDIEAIERAVAMEPQAKILLLCSPNNPDGGVIADEDLRRLLALPLLVLLDEAYVEFTAVASRMDWVLQYDNLVVLRTFSKLAGLAGLRVGYGAFPEWLLPHLWKIKPPYNINVAASLAALAALRDVGWLRQKVALIVAERERMVGLLAEFSFLRPLPSQSNFVLCQVIGRSAKALKLALEQAAVLVRYFDKPGVNNCIRVSVGRPEDSEALVRALREL